MIAVSAGDAHSIALKDDGTVWAWGNNRFGQLGDGTTTNKLTPVQVTGLSRVIAVSAGNDHNLALKYDGTVWTWGWHVVSRRDGTTENSVTPIQVAGLTGVTAISAGGAHSLALKGDRTVWAWGFNMFGQLGHGTTVDTTTPLNVTYDSRYLSNNVIAISAGGNHSLALRADGTVWAWGFNGAGQLGDGTTTLKRMPVQVTGLTGVTAISAGASHSLALKADDGKTVWVWGLNTDGQLGDGTTSPRTRAARSTNFSTDVIAVSAGGSQSFALKRDGAIWVLGQVTEGLAFQVATQVSFP